MRDLTLPSHSAAYASHAHHNLSFDLITGSPSYLVKKAHQQDILKTFIRSNGDFLKQVHCSAISESPNVTESQIS